MLIELAEGGGPNAILFPSASCVLYALSGTLTVPLLGIFLVLFASRANLSAITFLDLVISLSYNTCKACSDTISSNCDEPITK